MRLDDVSPKSGGGGHKPAQVRLKTRLPTDTGPSGVIKTSLPSDTGPPGDDKHVIQEISALGL